jgi:hypothetical protein
VHTSGEITAAGGVTASAHGLFIQPSASRIEELRESTEGRTA